MPSQGLAQLIIIAIVIATFILGLLFWKKFKPLRYFLHTVSGLFLAWAIAKPFIKSSLIIEEEKRIVGNYEFDPQSSQYDTVSLLNYIEMELIVSADNTFEIHNGLSFFNYTKGTWEVNDNGDFSSLSYRFNDSISSDVRTPDIWTFNGKELKNNRNKNKIVFVKK